MAEKQYPLTLLIRAVDKATGPLRAINSRIHRIGAPFRALGASLQSFSNEAGLPKLVDGFKGVGLAARGVGDQAFSLGTKIAAMAAIASVALFSIMKSAVDAGDELGEMSQRTGTTVDFFASFRHAAAQADVSAEDFNSSMDKFNKNLGEMRAGGGPIVSFLKKVSPALLQQMKGAKGTEQSLALMTGAFEKVKDPAKRAALAAAVFGKSGLQMGQFLGQGSAEIQKQMVEYMRLAGSQEEFAKSAGELDNALRPLEVAFLSVRNAIAGELFPVFKDLAEIATQLFVTHREEIRQWAKSVAGAIKAWMTGGGPARLIEDVKGLIATVSSLVERIGGWQNAALAIAAVVAGPLLVSIAVLTKAVIALGIALLTTPVGWVIAGIAAIAAAAFLLYKYWGPINAWFQENVWGPLTDGIVSAFTSVKTFLSETWDSIVGVFEAAWEKIKPIVDAIMEAAKLSPLGLAIQVGQSLLGDGERPNLGAEQAAGQLMSRSQAHVTVDFNNAPRGTRVATDASGGAQVDTSLGVNMSEAL